MNWLDVTSFTPDGRTTIVRVEDGLIVDLWCDWEWE